VGLHIFELSKELSGCSPEARFLLEAMVLLEQRTSAEAVAMSAKLLAKQLGLAEKLIRDAMAELTSARLVVVDDASSVRRGRPAIRYELASTVLSALPKRDGAYGVHADLLVRLFSAAVSMAARGSAEQVGKDRRVTKEGRLAPPGAANYLSACNRLLLATLLAHADPLGMVKSVSRGTLCRLTGLDEFSLTHRLGRLKSLGLILAKVPGLSSKLFPGARVNSTYFLNVTHPRLGGGNGAVWCRTFDPEISSPTLDQVLRPDLDRNFGAKDHPVRCFLKGGAAFGVLRPMILRYASYLLSHHREKLGYESSFDCQSLREKIAADFQRPAGWKVGDVSFDRDWAQVVDHFYQLAFRVARDFRRVVDIDYRFDEVCLVPLDGGFQYVLWLNVVDESHEGAPCAGS
jgi:hypothetical protein